MIKNGNKIKCPVCGLWKHIDKYTNAIGHICNDKCWDCLIKPDPKSETNNVMTFDDHWNEIMKELNNAGHGDIAKFIEEIDDEGKMQLVQHVVETNDRFVFNGLEHDIDFFKNSLALLYSVLEWLKKEIL